MELDYSTEAANISTEHLDQLRKELATLTGIDERLLDAVMVRVAPHMHGTATEAYAAGEAVATGVVPEAM